MDQTNCEVDNIINWLFEKIFNQLTFNGKELSDLAFDTVVKKTFQNENLYEIINKLTGKSINEISAYLSNRKFQEKFLFDKLKKKIHVQILFNDLPKIKLLIKNGYRIDNQCLRFAVLNNRQEIVQFIIDNYPNIKLENQLLVYCAGYGYEELYFCLRKYGLIPNISIYNKAVYGNSIKIITDVNENIAVSKRILEQAFQSNNTEIILYLLTCASNDKITINKNSVAYTILNNNQQILFELDKNKLIDWHHELYYSAILSGSLEMIKLVESKIPNLHDNLLLDTSRTQKGHKSLILSNIIYVVDDKKYFSHTINYAIQSKSLDVVKYIYSKGYGITISNFITAIKQSTVEILEFLCQVYHQKLPFYLIHYFGMNSYVMNKFAKAKVLFENRLLTLNFDKISINDYKIESVHLQMIDQITQISEDQCQDIDFLMKYCILFVGHPGSKINYRLITKTRICLELGLEEDLNDIYNTKYNEMDKQHIMDVLFLFGNISQIKNLYALQQPMISPSQQIIMEIICCCQINKLCYLVQNNLLPKSIINVIYPVVTMLTDQFLHVFFKKICQSEPNIKYVILSKNDSYILEWLDNNKISNFVVDKKTLKYILELENIDIIKKFIFSAEILPELIEWTFENDLMDSYHYLKNE
jgi:hypothetical protein